MPKAVKLAPWTKKMQQDSMKILKAFRAGKPLESVKGMRRVDTRLYHTPEVSRAARELAGMTQAEFARLMGVSVQTVHSWETARRRPRGLVDKVFRMVAEDPKLLARLAAA